MTGAIPNPSSSGITLPSSDLLVEDVDRSKVMDYLVRQIMNSIHSFVCWDHPRESIDFLEQSEQFVNSITENRVFDGREMTPNDIF